MRPKPIVQYEQIYAASIVIGLLSLIVAWPMLGAQAAASPLSPTVLGGIVLGAALIGLAINLLLLWLTARKGNEVARIIVAVFLVISLLSGLWGVLSGRAAGFAAIVGVVRIVLEILMLYLLFVPRESKAWFAPRAPLA